MSITRISHIQSAPIAVRFLSIEPLLSPMHDLNLEGISWVIVGGESGPQARPMNVKWVLEIRDKCAKEGVDFFFKQWGGRTSKSGGRLLNGAEYNAIPVVMAEEARDGLRMAS